MTAAVDAQTSTIGPTPRRGRAPSIGFLCVCATYLGVLAFLGYGLRTPDLDRIWTLHHELKIGLRGAPRGAERELLERALDRHPELASALLSEGDIGLISRNSDGWITTPEATIVRTRNGRRARAALRGRDAARPLAVPDRGQRPGPPPAARGQAARQL